MRLRVRVALGSVAEFCLASNLSIILPVITEPVTITLPVDSPASVVKLRS